jgi:hypothetical protein
VGLRKVFFLGLPVGAVALSGAFLYTGAPQYNVDASLRGGNRFPAGTEVRVFSEDASRRVAPSLAMSADPALSPDAQFVLFSGKARVDQPWQIWEVSLAGGSPRQVTSGADDCIRPFYAAPGKFVYARKTSQGYQIEMGSLVGRVNPVRLTWLNGDFFPDFVMRDGRVLFEAAFPFAPSTARDLYTVYTDGSGVETRRCEHGPDRHSASELASGDLIFQTGDGLARFTSARAGQVEIPLPRGQYVGPVAETEGGEWLATYRASAQDAYWICRFAPQAKSQPIKVVGPNAFQPVPIRVSTPPPNHPSSLGNRVGANLLCLNSYLSKSERIPKNSVTEVRVWSQNRHGSAIALGKAPVEADGCFYVQTPSEAPLRFELLDREGKTIAAEKVGSGRERASSACASAVMQGPSARLRT